MPVLDHQPIDLDQIRRDTAEVEADAQHTNGRDHFLTRNRSEVAPSIPDPTQDADDAGVSDERLDVSAEGNERQMEEALWEQLGAEHGLALSYSQNGEVRSLYENFWAARYRHERPAVFDDVRNAFYLYEKGVYREVSEDHIRRGLAGLLLRIGRLLHLDGLEKFRNARALGGIVTTLRALVVEHEPFARGDQHFIVLRNGVLLLREGRDPQLIPHDPAYRSTHAVAIDYDPQARCPRFKGELLSYMLPEVADRQLVQIYFGMALFGRNLAQRLLLLRGEGNDGKSQLINVLMELVGPNATLQLRTEHLGQRFEMGLIGTKSLLVGVDVPEDFLGAERSEVIKALVGGDSLTAEIKGSMREERVRGDKCLVATSNSRLRLRLRGDEQAWRRRLILLECAPPPRDRSRIADFGQMLLSEEGPGILNWALSGLRKLFEDGGQICLNEEQQARVDELLGESDTLAIYLRASLEPVRCDGESGRTSLTVDEIWNGYVAYCTGRQWSMMPKRVVERSLTELIPRLLHGRQSNNISDPNSTMRRVRGYRGVRWRDGEPPEGYQDSQDGAFVMH